MHQRYVGAYNAPALMDELLAAFPEWRGELAPAALGLAPGARMHPRLAVSATPDGVRLECPDDADLAAVRAVVAAHDPRKATPTEVRRRERQAALARLKADPAYADLVTALGL
jgi:hypothetical protein